MTPNFPEPVREPIEVSPTVTMQLPQAFRLQTESRQQFLSYFDFGGTPYYAAVRKPGINGSQEVSRPSSSASTTQFWNEDRWLPTPIRPVIATYPYHKKRKSSTVKQWNNEK